MPSTRTAGLLLISFGLFACASSTDSSEDTSATGGETSSSGGSSTGGAATGGVSATTGGAGGSGGEASVGGTSTVGGSTGSGGTTTVLPGPTECPDSLPVMCSCEMHNGAPYLFCNTYNHHKTWEQAEAFCNGFNMNLVRIDDEAENTWLVERLVAVGETTTLVWTGARDTGNLSWTWSDNGDEFYKGSGSIGQAVQDAYSNFATSEPSATGTCIGLSTATGWWDDQDCTGNKNPVCE